jgi:hypothetical protein
MTPKIKKVQHPYGWELLTARKDAAIVTGKPMVERPWWFENIETGQCYYDLVAGIAWPTEISEKDDGRAGYAAIVGIVKGQRKPQDAAFHLLAEAESKDIPTLLDHMLELRATWGHGIQPDLLSSWYGDPDKFVTTTALLNERLIQAGGDKASILITPPDDFYSPKAFEIYVRSMHSVIVPGKIRFGFGGNEILKNRCKEFKKDDPAIMAVGGVIHSLLSRTMWMSDAANNCFTVEG